MDQKNLVHFFGVIVISFFSCTNITLAIDANDDLQTIQWLPLYKSPINRKMLEITIPAGFFERNDISQNVQEFFLPALNNFGWSEMISIHKYVSPYPTVLLPAMTNYIIDHHAPADILYTNNEGLINPSCVIWYQNNERPEMCFLKYISGSEYSHGIYYTIALTDIDETAALDRMREFEKNNVRQIDFN